MDRTEVAGFYRGKGYLVHESVVVTGQSGNQSRVPLLCEGPLGSLAVFFGDAAGIDGPEIGAAKRVAKDLGATAVVAAESFSPAQRRAAAELGVVLLDAASIEAPVPASLPSAWPGQTPGAALERDLHAHPWPASGRPGGTDGPSHSVAHDVDELLGEAAPPAPTQSAPSLRAPLASAAAPSDPALPAMAPAAHGDLWKRPRANATPAPAAPPSGSARPAQRQAFAWLDLPKPPAPAAEIEYSGTLSARAVTPTAAPLTAEELAAQRQERLLREAMVRAWVRRGAWTLGVALFLYLFLLWWL